ncbi:MULTISPECIES: helix-turn-helix domain-containing protein [unclassified Mesorhizobium]|uniref:helix-turn-helix domain-containing protein n=1 Tax=unclassified Mesorhizobium TaxID=325217 RepID=UPI0011266132|nr:MULTISPECIES: helix-turn-helix domain-containing protein [unclassified Mesorhizobium]TPL67538.1 helix-turn-helix domain-containing protein [Mesorhizobium sp. B2-3-15]TPL99409.1 helix-turn-helix domain-containing protein [Mesorhizobium sp. B2-3-10]
MTPLDPQLEAYVAAAEAALADLRRYICHGSSGACRQPEPAPHFEPQFPAEWLLQPDILTPKQAGHLARRSECTITRWCKGGRIGTRFGGRYETKKAELFEYVSNHP